LNFKCKFLDFFSHYFSLQFKKVRTTFFIYILLLLYFQSYSQTRIEIEELPASMEVKSKKLIVLKNSNGKINVVEIPTAVVFLKKLKNMEIEKSLLKYDSTPQRSYFLYSLATSFFCAGLGQIGLNDGRGILFVSGSALSLVMTAKINNIRHLKNAVRIYNKELYEIKLYSEN